MLYLFDENRALTTVIAEYESIITTRAFSEFSTWTGRFPAEAYDALIAATYAVVADEDEVYLVECVTLNEDERTVTVDESRSALALLHDRTVEGTLEWSATPLGEIISDLLASLTGARALPLAFSSGLTAGDSVSLQVSWGDMGQTVLDLLASGTLGIKCAMSGTDIAVTVFEPTAVDTLVGQVYGNASGGKIVRDERSWKNYAIVLGEGEGAARIRQDVDQTGSDALRELYVDARDLQQDALSEAAYKLVLAQRGREKLAETRVIEYAESSTDAPLSVGDVPWYDSGRFSATLMVSRSETTRESGTVKQGATLGEPPPTLRRMIRRESR